MCGLLQVLHGSDPVSVAVLAVDAIALAVLHR